MSTTLRASPRLKAIVIERVRLPPSAAVAMQPF
jgi:hypothetical protein